MSDAPTCVAVVGSGLAGLVAAVETRAGGAEVVVFNSAPEPGGTARWSAGWIWRYRDMRTFRTLAPHGDADVQRAIVERLDDDLAWLEQLGAVRVAASTGRSFTVGMRIDPPRVVDALARRLGRDALQLRRQVVDARRVDGGIELRVVARNPGLLDDEDGTWQRFDRIVLAGGGYASNLARVAREAVASDEVAGRWLRRGAPGCDGSSTDVGLALGGARMPASGESFVRLVPHGLEPLDREAVRAGELHELATALLDEHGEPLERGRHDWTGAQQAWELARRSGGGWLVLDRAALRSRVPAGRAEDVVRAVAASGGTINSDASGGIRMRVRAGFTHTICGLRVDSTARLVPPARSGARGLLARRGADAVPGTFVAGSDAAGTGAGGYASGLAQALVLGRLAGAGAAAPAGR